MELSDVIMELLLFLRQLWRSMLFGVGVPCIQVLQDNEGAVHFVQNPITNPRSSTWTYGTIFIEHSYW